MLQVAVMKQGWELRERELQQRLQTREQSHSKSVEELREMLNSQFRVTTRSHFNLSLHHVYPSMCYVPILVVHRLIYSE